MKAKHFERRFVLASALLAAAASFAAPAAAQSQWPERNVTVVVPLGAGSASDIIARIVMDQVGRQVGKSFIIENRPGAGGSTGSGQVARASIPRRDRARASIWRWKCSRR